VTLILVLTSRIEAQVQLDRFFPCAVSAGSTTTIKAEGKFPTWPVELVADRSDATWKLSEESGTIEITVSDRAYPGVLWLRAKDATSSSDLVPLLISNVPCQTESEPNQKWTESNAITLPVCICGRLEKSGDLDSYRLSAKKGERIVVSLTGNRILASPMDAVLQISDDRGNVLFQEDDTRGLDPSIHFESPEEGEYLIRVFAFPETPNSTIGYSGAANYVYSLNVASAESSIEHYLPLHQFSLASETDNANSSTPSAFAPFGWNSFSESQVLISVATEVSPRTAHCDAKVGWQWIPEIMLPVGSVGANPCIIEKQGGATTQSDALHEVPFSYSGHIREAKEVDTVRFRAQAEKRYRASIDSKRLGYPIDTSLSIVSAQDGSVVAKNDDQSRNDYDSAVSFSTKEDAILEVKISDAVDGHGPHHAYSLVVQEIRPSFTLSVPAQRFSIESGKEIEVAITVNRLDGFDKPIEVSLETFEDDSINETISSESVTSEPKGDTAKSVKLMIKTNEKASYQGYMQIVGRSISEGDAATASEPTPATFSLRPEINLSQQWLNVKPAK